MMTSRAWRRLTAPMLLLILAIGTACSFSYSSKSSSESSASSSGSSASSSRTAEDEYRDEVRDYTAAYVKSGGQFDAFTRGLGDLAKKHGITNWEDNEATYIGIGKGLGVAKVNQMQLDTYKTNLGAADPKKQAAIQKGYDSEK